MRLVLVAVATAFLVLGVEATGATAKVTAPTLAGAQPAPPDDSAPPASESDGKVVEVRTGVATLDALLKTGTVTRDHDVYVLHQPVNVRPGATLHLDGAKLLLAGGPEPASILVGGTFTATNTTISGGDGPRADRAEIIVRAGGALVSPIERRRSPRRQRGSPGHHRAWRGGEGVDFRHHHRSERAGTVRDRCRTYLAARHHDLPQSHERRRRPRLVPITLRSRHRRHREPGRWDLAYATEPES